MMLERQIDIALRMISFHSFEFCLLGLGAFARFYVVNPVRTLPGGGAVTYEILDEGDATIAVITVHLAHEDLDDREAYRTLLGRVSRSMLALVANIPPAQSNLVDLELWDQL